MAIACGSNEETRSQLYRARDNDFISEIEFEEAMYLVHEISNINAFIIYLKGFDFKGTKFMKEDDTEYC